MGGRGVEHVQRTLERWMIDTTPAPGKVSRLSLARRGGGSLMISLPTLLGTPTNALFHARRVLIISLLFSLAIALHVPLRLVCPLHQESKCGSPMLLVLWDIGTAITTIITATHDGRDNGSLSKCRRVPLFSRQYTIAYSFPFTYGGEREAYRTED
ncbi:hypothetical protein F4824DRAFT_395990 [Ustulina deusta]|nr:hypothetical protein F4824DRAFT_395990 [Ustulina deusta]